MVLNLPFCKGSLLIRTCFQVSEKGVQLQNTISEHLNGRKPFGRRIFGRQVQYEKRHVDQLKVGQTVFDEMRWKVLLVSYN